MRRSEDPMAQIESIVGNEQRRAAMHAKTHHIETFFEKSVRRSLKQLPGETGDVQRAEGIAAAKLGIPVEWCPYDEAEGHANIRYSAWQEGHGIGRVYREAVPPNLEILERLGSLLLRRLNKNERDYERRLVAMIAYERRQVGKAHSELAEARKQLKQAKGRFGKAIESPTQMLRIMVYEGGGKWHACCPGIHGVRGEGETKEEAIRYALDHMTYTLEGVMRDGDILTLEWMQPEETETPCGDN